MVYKMSPAQDGVKLALFYNIYKCGNEEELHTFISQ